MCSILQSLCFPSQTNEPLIYIIKEIQKDNSGAGTLAFQISIKADFKKEKGIQNKEETENPLQKLPEEWLRAGQLSNLACCHPHVRSKTYSLLLIRPVLLLLLLFE